MAFPAIYNFTYYKGDTNQFVISPKNSDGSAFDLDGYVADYTIATSRGDSPQDSWSADATINASSNIVTCTITSSVGSSLEGTNLVYDVQIATTGATPIVYTLLTGIITLTDQVTGANP